MRFLKFILTFTIFLTAFVGDYIVFKSKYSQSWAFRAFSDSLVHGSIGFLSAALFFSYKFNISNQVCIYNIILCTAISSLIDIDHFFVAKSIYLKDLRNLKHRGIFHCTTFWMLVTCLLLSYSYIANKLNVYIVTVMVVLAFTSHHIRDGNRRGLWMYPYGHTPPIHNYLYITLLGIIPNLLAYLFVNMKNDYFNLTQDTIKYNELVV